MKKFMKTILILLIIIILVIFLVGLLFVGLIYMGELGSRKIANEVVDEYIEQSYQDMELEKEKPKINFREERYDVKVKSRNSIDTHFTIAVSVDQGSGKVISDDYASRVLDKENTWDRISDDYREIVDKAFLDEKLPYDPTAWGTIRSRNYKNYYSSVEAYGVDLEYLEIDGIYDVKELAKTGGHIDVGITKDQSMPESLLNSEIAAELMLEVKEILDRRKIPFYALSLDIYEPYDLGNKKSFKICDFLYSDIYEDDLAKRIDDAVKEYEEYIKEKKQKNQ